MLARTILNRDVDPAGHSWTPLLAALEHRRVLPAGPCRHRPVYGISNGIQHVWWHRSADLIHGLKVELGLLLPPLQRIRPILLAEGSARQLPIEIHRERCRIPDQIERHVGPLRLDR